MRVGPYEVVDEIGRGGMGVVYRARDPELDREVALKVLLNTQGTSPTQRKRFQREVESLARLNHPHVVRVHSAGEHDGHPYLVMDLLPGTSLQAYLNRNGPLDSTRAAEISLKLADAVAHAHELGILHRDLKPENVILSGEDQEPVLTDFGLAKDLDASLSGTQLSLGGRYMGTPGFWSPEQASGRLDDMGPPTDVYGLGAILYALLTNQPPIQGPSLVEVAIATNERKPTPPSQVRPDVDPRLAAICLRCLEKSPADRYPSATALAADLTGWATSTPSLAARASGGKTILALFIMAMLAAGAITLAASWTPEPPDVRPTAVASATPSAEPPRLRWALEVGDVLRYQLTWEEHHLPAGSAREMRIRLSVVAQALRVVDGRAELSAEIEDIHVFMESPGTAIRFPFEPGQAHPLDRLSLIRGQSFRYQLDLTTGGLSGVKGLTDIGRSVVPDNADPVADGPVRAVSLALKDSLYESGMHRLHQVLGGGSRDAWMYESGKGYLKYRRDGDLIRVRGHMKAVRVEQDRRPTGAILMVLFTSSGLRAEKASGALGGEAVFRAGRLRSSKLEQTLNNDGRPFRITRWHYEAK